MIPRRHSVPAIACVLTSAPALASKGAPGVAEAVLWIGGVALGTLLVCLAGGVIFGIATGRRRGEATSRSFVRGLITGLLAFGAVLVLLHVLGFLWIVASLVYAWVLRPE